MTQFEVTSDVLSKVPQMKRPAHISDREFAETYRALANSLRPSAAFWGRTDKATVIREIDSNTHFYFVMVAGAGVAVKVVSGPRGRYLRTDPDKTTRNNLDDLPNC